MATIVNDKNKNLILTILRFDANFLDIAKISKIEYILDNARYLDPYHNRLMFTTREGYYFVIERNGKENILYLEENLKKHEYKLNSKAFDIINSLYEF